MFTILHTIDVPAFLFIVILIILSLLWDLKKILPGSKSSTTSWRYREPTTSMDGELTRPVFTKPSGSASLVSALCVPVSMHRTIVPPMRRWLLFFHFTDRETEAETSVHLPEATRLESGGAGIKKKRRVYITRAKVLTYGISLGWKCGERTWLFSLHLTRDQGEEENFLIACLVLKSNGSSVSIFFFSLFSFFKTYSTSRAKESCG